MIKDYEGLSMAKLAIIFFLIIILGWAAMALPQEHVPNQTTLTFSTVPGCLHYASSEKHLPNVPECAAKTVGDVLRAHQAIVHGIQSCQARHWPVEDVKCHGYALALAGWFVDEHPEYFGPDALKQR